MMTDAESLRQRLLAAYQNNQLAEAEALAHEGRRFFPDHPFFTRALATLLVQTGRPEAAVPWLESLIQGGTAHAEVWNTYGVALRQLGRLDEARRAFRHALAHDPTLEEAAHTLADLEDAAGRTSSAIHILQSIAQPRHPGTLNNLGTYLLKQGDTKPAETAYRKALVLDPHSAEIWCNLANTLTQTGQIEAALQACERALQLAPDLPAVRLAQAQTLYSGQRWVEAELSFRLVLGLDKSSEEAFFGLGSLLGIQQRWQELRQLADDWLIPHPDSAKGHVLIAQALSALSNWSSVSRHIDYPTVQESTNGALRERPLFFLPYHPDLSDESLLNQFSRWGDEFCPTAAYTHPMSPRSPSSRLRIGFVSADFKEHPCRHFVLPLLENLNHECLEVFLYSGVRTPDSITALFKQYADVWVEAWSLSDAELAAHIAGERIDVLIDLSGHTAGHRLAVFALKPAPVQCTWIGFGNTTGVPGVDYFIGDEVFTPEGAFMPLREQAWRMDSPSYTYRPPESVPVISPLPYTSNGYLTFGSLSRTVRLNDQVFSAWASILEQVPHSRLRLDQRLFERPEHVNYFKTHLQQWGIDPTRLECVNSSPHWLGYHAIDIALDPFPHNAGTTTFEALWMGVPVLTLRSRPPRGHFGAYALAPLGLHEWIADTPQDYIAKAVALARDIPALATLRNTLRQRMQASPIMDHAGFARRFEDMLFAMRACGPKPAQNERVPRQPMGLEEPSLTEEIPDIAGAGTDADVDTASVRDPVFSPVQAETEPQGTLPPSCPIPDLCQLAREAMERGNWAEAEQCLQRLPDLEHRPEALLLHGSLLKAQGQLAEAARRFLQAVQVAPEYAEGYNNLGTTFHALGEIESAEASLGCALEIQPDFGPAHFNLANLLAEQHRFDDAERHFAEARRLLPNNAGILVNWAESVQKQHDPARAIDLLRQATALDPQLSQAHHNLGVILFLEGDSTEAESCLYRALALAPRDPQILCSLAEVYSKANRNHRVLQLYRQVLDISPEHSSEYAQALQGTASAHARLSEWDRYWHDSDRALALAPRDRDIWHGRLFDLGYHPDITPAQLLDNFQAWGRVFQAQPTYVHDPAAHPANPKLRVGFVSADLREHAVSYFILPLIEHLSHQQTEWTAYSSSRKHDAYTSRYQRSFDHWHDVSPLDDAALAEKIHADQIDILIDLSGHTGGHRLETFSHKPAPIQLTWIGFGNTTGLSSMDYFLGDEALTPFDAPPHLAEKVWRMASPSYCYAPPTSAPDVTPLPALKNGFITFGSLSRTIRFNETVFRAWGKVLQALPDSRLRLDQKVFTEPATCEHYRAMAERCGIPRDRLDLVATPRHWDSYAEIDISLDPFPHNAGTTHFESLWMGVPVLTKNDRAPVGRFGAYALTPLDLDEWIAGDETELISKAAQLAGNIKPLAELRAQLRERMRASPIMDYAGFAQRFEFHLHQMWADWHSQAVGANSTDPPLLLPTALSAQDQALARLNRAPDDAQAWYELGVAHATHQALPQTPPHHRDPQAMHCLRHALRLSPQHAPAWHTLGSLLLRQQRLPEARVALQQALELNPLEVETRLTLSEVLIQQGELETACQTVRQGTILAPQQGRLWNQLGVIQILLKHYGKAEVSLGKALDNLPDSALTLTNLGNLLRLSKRFDQALSLCSRAVELDPDLAQAWTNLACLQLDTSHLTACLTSCEKALTLSPHHFQSLMTQVLVLNRLGRYATSQEKVAQMTALFPDSAETWMLKASLAANLGTWSEFLPAAERACALAPQDEKIRHPLNFSIGYHPDLDSETLHRYLHDWGQRFPEAHCPISTPDPERQLRIGYVSADFRDHACSHFLRGLLDHHDHPGFHITAYSVANTADKVTDQLRSVFDGWHDVAHLDDPQLAQRIRSDHIDILVDLAGHTGENRLGAFALKPAPIQLTWIGYGNTTGLAAMDYFLGDEALTPPGTEAWMTEKIWRIPSPSYSYSPPPEAPAVAPLPALRNGFITFGSQSRTIRFNHKVYAAWRALLERVPNARLRLDQRPFADPDTRALFAQTMASHGLPMDRVDLVSTPNHWEGYHAMDISLDPFPHNAGTTHFESLWMGVPVITKTDRPPLGRFGAYALHPLGMDDWITDSVEAYITCAATWAGRIPQLAVLRSSLRERMQNSPLLDHAAFARKMERAYREMWRDLCQSNSIIEP